MFHTRPSLALVASLTILLGACGEKKETTGPVAVKVNGVAITAVELESRMKQFGGGHAGNKGEMSGKLLNGLIDKELLRQAAVKDKLDQDALVRSRITEANRMILADAFMEKVLAAQGKPGPAETKAYYDQHPEMFSDRHAYDLQEEVIQTTPEIATEIKTRFGDGKHFTDFVRWLDEKKIPHTSNKVTKTPEQLPEEIMQKLKNLQAGEAFSVEDKGRMNIVCINAMQPQPVTFDQATMLITNYLSTKRTRDGMTSKMKELRDQAKIEFVPPYTAAGMPAGEEK